KGTDLVGRWGGEEFVISLPNTNAAQARQIAERIRETMALFLIHGMDEKTIPVPTVSQGIAIFPDEADEIIRLIDLADQRLYIAKSRGRNQVEPDSFEWAKSKTDENK
ncbi:MAG: GGDEF domain-containing protein, partial [Chloroflexi bacterium]|nr:GGDEF domain-containing protein [Chloroflexota bacterium]